MVNIAYIFFPYIRSSSGSHVEHQKQFTSPQEIIGSNRIAMARYPGDLPVSQTPKITFSLQNSLIIPPVWFYDSSSRLRKQSDFLNSVIERENWKRYRFTDKRIGQSWFECQRVIHQNLRPSQTWTAIANPMVTQRADRLTWSITKTHDRTWSVTIITFSFNWRGSARLRSCACMKIREIHKNCTWTQKAEEKRDDIQIQDFDSPVRVRTLGWIIPSSRFSVCSRLRQTRNIRTKRRESGYLILKILRRHRFSWTRDFMWDRKVSALKRANYANVSDQELRTDRTAGLMIFTNARSDSRPN
jgi:hypothetical protein